MLNEYKRLDSKIKSINAKLKSFPKSNFYATTTRKKYFKWYRVDNGNAIYIPKSKRKTAEKLAYRRYLLSFKEDLTNEMNAIKTYLDQHESYISEADQLLKHPAYQELLYPYFKPISQELSEWSKASYEKSTLYPEKLIHKTASGNEVRSKSEAIIDTFLHINQIPFRYESPLKLGNKIIHPEFTIRHPSTGEYFYWEHFGMMDKSDYSKKAFNRIKLYNSHGIYPSINLIMTFETEDHPLTAEVVEKIIEHYFL